MSLVANLLIVCTSRIKKIKITLKSSRPLFRITNICIFICSITRWIWWHPKIPSDVIHWKNLNKLKNYTFQPSVSSVYCEVSDYLFIQTGFTHFSAFPSLPLLMLQMADKKNHRNLTSCIHVINTVVICRHQKKIVLFYLQ